MRLKGITTTMTAAGLNAVLAAYPCEVLDLRGVRVNCEAVVTVPSRVRKIIGGKFYRAAGLGTSDWMLALGTADVGSSNARFATMSPVTIAGSVSEGATALTHGSALTAGWYMAYGDSSTGDAVTHSGGATTLYYSAELVRITGYSGGAIQLQSPLTRDYTTLKLVAWTPMFSVEIEGCYFDGYNGAAAGCGSCLVVAPCLGVTVRNCEFRGFTVAGLKVACATRVKVVNCKGLTDSGSSRYHYEFGRCTSVYVSGCRSDGGRWGVTGQGIRYGVTRNSYFEYGTDAMDHGCNGKYVVMENVTKLKNGTGAFNTGNSAWFAGTREVLWVNCDMRSATPTSVDEVAYAYPNSSVRFESCLMHQIKCSTYPPGASGLVGDQGPISITVGAGTTVERGTYGTHATATGPGGGDVIQFLYNDVPYAAGSKLTTFTLEAGAHMKSCTFAAPVRAEGLVGTCTFNISGGLWVQWVSASVPCILVNDGNHTINLNTGFVMGNTQGTQPSATYDAVRVNAGVSGCTINRGSNAISKWSSGASQATLTPMPSDRVNDVSGLATIV